MSNKNGERVEREFVRMMNAQGLLCHRVVGSGCANDAVCDCILFDTKPCLVEVKTTRGDTFYFNKPDRLQLLKLVRTSIKKGLRPLIAIKFRNKGWNLTSPKSFAKIQYNQSEDISKFPLHSALYNDRSLEDGI